MNVFTLLLLNAAFGSKNYHFNLRGRILIGKEYILTLRKLSFFAWYFHCFCRGKFGCDIVDTFFKNCISQK